MFGTILLGAAALITGYVFWRMGGIPWLDFLSWRARLGLGVLAWALVWSGWKWGHGREGQWPSLAELVGMDLLAVLFLAFALLLFTDLITGYGWFLPRMAPVLRGFALLGCLALSVAAIVQGLRPPVIHDYETTLPGLPAELDGLTIAAMSDLHIGQQLGPKWLQARVEQVMALKPDMIVLLGDIVEGHSSRRDALLPIFRELRAPLGVFAVPGNHERYGSMGKPMQILADAGAAVLANRWASPAPGLTIAGVEDLTIHSLNAPGSDSGSDPVAEALKNRPDGATILLSHSPMEMAEAEARGVGLMLCGHTHGGQIWPFGWLIRLRFPLVEGKHQMGRMTVIVSRGAGTWGPRMRLFKPGEILRIVLRSP